MPAVKINPIDQIGRNDPCWCGSGRKLGRCHGDLYVVEGPVPAARLPRDPLQAVVPAVESVAVHARPGHLSVSVSAPQPAPEPPIERDDVARWDDDVVGAFALGGCLGAAAVVLAWMLPHGFPPVEHLAAVVVVLQFPLVVADAVRRMLARERDPR